MQSVQYHIIPAEPKAHQFLVRIEAQVTEALAGNLQIFLPTWIPGSYLVRDFARHLQTPQIQQNGQVLDVEQIDRQSWRCAPQAGAVTIEYRVYAHDESVRAAFLDDTRGFFNPTSLCLRIAGLEDLPCDVKLDMPEGYGSWQVVTTLPETNVQANGFGDYQAENYWDLIDHPVAMGRSVRRVPFVVAGVPHEFVLLGPVNAVDTQRLAQDLAAVCDAQASVIGDLPVEKYLFMALITEHGLGGIEHRHCSVLQVARQSLPRPHETERSKAYRLLLGLCSHEYFHLWNVKRIRPAAVANSDLTQEAYFTDLWAYEGVTSYYDDLALVRSGVITVEQYLARLAQLITRIVQTPGQTVQSLAQSSFDAWLKFYQPNENTPNTVISYYAKGALLALVLDLSLRQKTQGKVSLDTLMQHLWDDYGEDDIPVPDGRLEQLASEVSGVDFSDFFARYLYSTQSIDWQDLLASFGLSAHQEVSDKAADILRGRLGLALDGARVKHVYAGEPAQLAGIAPQDKLIALNNLDIEDRPEKHVQRVAPNGTIRAHLFRDGQLIVRDIKTAATASSHWQLSLDNQADAAAKERQQSWLGFSA